MAPIPSLQVPVIWILGGPGSGKGTQCDKIVEKYGFTHLSSGDLLRAEVESGSDVGKELTTIMEKGELVPMEIVLDLIKTAILNALPTSTGFLIDGYPREREQGIMFEENIAPVNMIVFFEASEDTLINRLLERAKTSGRVDDNIDTIKKRLNTFNVYTNAILEEYSNKLLRAFSEMKTNVRGHARELKYRQTGTGGGGVVKPLTDFEERLLALISMLNIEGVELPEAGCSENKSLYEFSEILVMGDEVMLEPDELQNNLVVEETDNENTLPASKNYTQINPPATPNHPRNRKRIKRTGEISRGRVETALVTHDQNLRELTNSNLAIAKSINMLARAINVIAKKMR